MSRGILAGGLVVSGVHIFWWLAMMRPCRVPSNMRAALNHQGKNSGPRLRSTAAAVLRAVLAAYCGPFSFAFGLSSIKR